jgi:predicted membrane protein
MNNDTSKSTMLTISMGFLLLYLIFDREWAVFVSLVVGLIGIVSPFLSRKIEWIWMKIAKVLGYIVPNILLSIVFYVFLFPLAFLSRLFSKDPLMLSDKHKSYFVDINEEVEKDSFEKTW